MEYENTTLENKRVAHKKSEQPRCDFVSHLKLEQQLAAEREKVRELERITS